MNEVVVSLGMYRQNHFNYGQIYVALSRGTSLQGLHVTGQIENERVRANPKVHTEYQKMSHNWIILTPILQLLINVVSDFRNLKVCLLNIRSLREHSIDKCNKL